MTRFNNVDEIIKAVSEGKTVHVGKDNYQVVKGNKFTPYLIKCLDNDYCIGLTWLDGETLNADLKDFYIEGSL